MKNEGVKIWNRLKSLSGKVLLRASKSRWRDCCCYGKEVRKYETKKCMLRTWKSWLFDFCSTGWYVCAAWRYDITLPNRKNTHREGKRHWRRNKLSFYISPSTNADLSSSTLGQFQTEKNFQLFLPCLILSVVCLLCWILRGNSICILIFLKVF